MQKLSTLFTSSYRELNKVSTITTAAMCGALSMVMKVMFTVMLDPTNRLSLYGLPNQVVYYLFGPVVGPLYGAAMDILNYLVNPGGSFFPLFTLNAALMGLLYGLMLYQRPLNLWRVLAAELVVIVICNLLINTYALSLLYGKSFMVMLPARITKNIIMWPVKSLLFYLVMKPLEYSGLLRALKRPVSQ